MAAGCQKLLLHVDRIAISTVGRKGSEFGRRAVDHVWIPAEKTWHAAVPGMISRHVVDLDSMLANFSKPNGLWSFCFALLHLISSPPSGLSPVLKPISMIQP
jgi:hypothetical protein